MESRSSLHIFLCCAFLFFCACDRHTETSEKAQQLPVQEVRVATVVKQPVVRENEVMGTVTAVERATISSRAGGIIKELPIELGSIVRKGDVLARIGAEEIAARLSRSETVLKQARRNLDREKRLLEKGAATRERVKELEEALRIAEAGYREAQAMFGYTTVTAPFSGLVSQKMVNAGDLAAPGTPLLVLENNRNLQVVVEVPEALSLQIRRDQELPVSVPAAGFSGSGKVAEIGPTTDPLSRTATIKITVEEHARTRPGQFARVTFSGNGGDALLVPESAVLFFGQMEKLFVVRDSKALLRLVRTGRRSNGMAEILSGLNGGEEVVYDNADRLIDGQPIRVMP
jgi:membrane fusion protein (multidrug efflux system)